MPHNIGRVTYIVCSPGARLSALNRHSVCRVTGADSSAGPCHHPPLTPTCFAAAGLCEHYFKFSINVFTKEFKTPSIGGDWRIRKYCCRGVAQAIPFNSVRELVRPNSKVDADALTPRNLHTAIATQWYWKWQGCRSTCPITALSELGLRCRLTTLVSHGPVGLQYFLYTWTFFAPWG